MSANPEFLAKLRRIKFWTALICGNVVLAFFAFAVVYGDSRRWLVVAPFLLVVAYLEWLAVRRFVQRKASPWLGMPIIYACGIAYVVVWTIADFKWWKCVVIAFGIVRLIYFVVRRKDAGHDMERLDFEQR